MMIFFAMMAGISIIGCSLSGNNTDDMFATDDEIYMFSAISSASLLEANPVALAQPLAMTLSDAETLLVEDEIDEINKYVQMMEKYLAGANGLSIMKSDSDRPEYQYKLIFSSVDMLGETVEYLLYYNESTTDDFSTVVTTSEDLTTTESDETETEEMETTETDIDDDDDDNDDETEFEDEDDDDDAEEESETFISGILVINETEYAVTGKEETEADESKVSITSWIDSENYVFVESKIEDGERKFNYEIVVSGTVQSSSEIKIETEEDEMKFELEFISGTASGKYEFKQETEDETNILKIEYEVTDGTSTESGEITLEVIIDEITNDTSYAYHIETDDDESSTVEQERDDDEDDDDEEEEDDLEDDEETTQG